MQRVLTTASAWLTFGLAILLSACSSKPKTSPCSLLPIHEAQLFDERITKSEWYPPHEKETNELCMYTDDNGERYLMLFAWSDKSLDPSAVIKDGMKGSGSKVVEIAGIGEKAAAGFQEDLLKMFSAKSSVGMVGIRVREPIKDGDEKFEKAKDIVAKALSRLK